jgi:peroxiredoxin
MRGMDMTRRSLIGTAFGLAVVGRAIPRAQGQQAPLTPRDNLFELPKDLPVPKDDGACRHLVGMRMPSIALKSTGGGSVDIASVEAPRVIIFAYPRTGEPGKPVPEGWDAIPGARGCTPETCGFRDHHDEFVALKGKVFGLSTQTTEYQKEMVDRLHVPFDVLSDQDLSLTRALRLPTFEFAGMTLIKRLTLVVRNGAVEHVFYPVFPPDRHAEEVLGWLRNAPGA